MKATEAQKKRMRAYHVANADRLREAARVRGRAYYKANKEKVQARVQAWVKANPGKTKARSRRWYQENKERHLLGGRVWRAKNTARVKQNNVLYKARNIEKVKTWGREARRRRLGLPKPTRRVPKRCECCKQIDKRALSLDHCHVSNAFRGWLCGKCNRGIGLLGDTLKGVQRAVKYLTTFGGIR